MSTNNLRLLKQRIQSAVARSGQTAVAETGRSDLHRDDEARVNAVSQLTLMLSYQQRQALGLPGLALNDVEFRAFSQNGEDGILWYILSLIGTTNKRAVEISAGDGSECNCANLIINHGWTALLVDGDERNVAKGKEFYSGHPQTFTYPPRFVHAWVDAESVNELLASHEFNGDIDLLSLDIDGVDYWIWHALTEVRPRLVVAEVQVIWGDARSVTVPYHRDFRAEYVDGFGIYSGASLPAFVKLARAKGYRLIGTQRYGFNAFFLRDDVAPTIFPEVEPSACLTHPFVRWCEAKLLPLVQSKQWVEV